MGFWEARHPGGSMRAVLTNPSRKEHTMRKSITTILTSATMAAALLAGSSTAAQAATCSSWKMPSKTTLIQSNGYKVNLVYATDRQWHATASGGLRSNEIVFSSSGPRSVRYVITWTNGSGGVYTGSIDNDGFVSGTTVDRFKPTSRAYWRMTNLARCAR